MTIRHLGVNLRLPEKDLRLSRENYIQNRCDGSPIYSFGEMSDDELKEHIERCMVNFDLNMGYSKKLDREEFSQYVDSYLSSHPSFKEISDLPSYKGVPVVYLMVLDEYKQVYLGTTNNLHRRICGHWTRKKPIDRLIFGTMVDSRLSIDSFRALDTTRLYARVIDENNKFTEEVASSEIDDRYSLCRTAHGFLSGGLQDAIEQRVPRNLIF